MVAERTPEYTPRPRAVRAFVSRLRGQVMLPDRDGYDEARRVWNGAADRRPALIVRPAGAEDVAAAVRFAREHDLPLAVRSGGHSMVGHGTTDGGVVGDLSSMKGLHLDPVRRIARAHAGLTWREYATRAQEFGLATSSGDTASVGVSGLTLGGGIGWMVRRHGLTIDHLIAAQVVTADGRIVRAGRDEHPDLFWALRGGGGNFGIATAFEFRLHEVGTVFGGGVAYRKTEAARVRRAYREYAATAPEGLTTIVFVLRAPPLPFIPEEIHGEWIVLIGACFTGDMAEGERVMAPLRTLGTPVADLLGPMPYPGIFTLGEAGEIRGLHHAVRTMFLNDFDDDLIETTVAHMERAGALVNMAQIRVLGGAMARVPAAETAFAHRDKPYLFTIIAVWPDPRQSAQHQAWAEAFWQAVRPRAAGAYVNFLQDDGEARIHEAYPSATYTRLAAIKRRYDPTNLFRLNQNIKPVG
jgi:FAD/FMN-containing dehydrogenase